MLKFGLLLGLLAVTVSGTRTVGHYVTEADRLRYTRIFTESLDSTDLQGIYYSALNQPAGDKAAVCKKLSKLHAESKLNDFEKNFYLVGASKKLGCTEKLSVDLKDAFTKEYSTTQEIYFTFLTAKALGKTLSAETQTQIGKNLQSVLKKDDSLASLAAAFHVAAEIGTQGEFALKRIDGTLAQADEVDGKFLQFEGGLSITGAIISGIVKLTKALKKPFPLNVDQSTKFTAYFLSRRSVQAPKGVSVLLEALEALNTDTATVPACIVLGDNGQLSPSSVVLKVRVTDIFGRPLTVTPTVRILEKTTELFKGTLTQTADKAVYQVDVTKENLKGGKFVVKVDAGPYKQDLSIIILQKAVVKSIEIAVQDLESTSVAKKATVSNGQTLKEVLQADTQQKLVLKFTITDERSSSPMTLHQVFVRLVNKKTTEEIIFIAEQDSSKAYKFDMDIGARASDFGQKSGVYGIELILGDASISNSVTWNLADIQLKFSGDVQEDSRPIRKPLPEIIHKFREPEKRPPRFFSDLFTALCAAPILILLILWARLGINVSNFPCSLSAPAFHAGLGSIFALFVCFWLKLNMFQTLQYLLPLGLFTFLAGNKLLRTIAARRLEKGEK